MNQNFPSSTGSPISNFLAFARYLIYGDHVSPIPNVREDLTGQLSFEGLSRGAFVIGKPGSGKTKYIAALVVAYALAYPNRGALVLDASGPLINDIVSIILGLSPQLREVLEKRLVVDILNHAEFTHTMPEFHKNYEVPLEKQVQRAAENLRRLNQKTLELPMLGKPTLEEMAPELFRLLSVTENELGETFQITEAARLLMDNSQMSIALNRFGSRAPEAKWYFEQYSRKQIGAKEYEMRSYTLRSVLGVIEPREIRARLGYYKPTWTVPELVKKNLICLVDGELMLDQELQLNYIFTQIYSMFRQEMNKRRPDDPNDAPFMLVIDEAPITFKVPGLAREIGEISTFYRSRKLWLVLVVQALWQLAEELREQVWSMGNLVSFSIDDVEDARKIAEQMFHYAPRMVKQEPKNTNQNPITEPDHGQYTMHANWIQSFNQREMVMRRYLDEARMDRFIRHVSRTPDVPSWSDREEIEEFKERIFKQRAIPIRDALEVINQRKLTAEPRQPPQL